MTPKVIEPIRPHVPAADRPTRQAAATADDWSRLIRALAVTDDDDLPLFGRMPG
jgi:hypothetical protein